MLRNFPKKLVLLNTYYVLDSIAKGIFLISFNPNINCKIGMAALIIQMKNVVPRNYVTFPMSLSF